MHIACLCAHLPRWTQKHAHLLAYIPSTDSNHVRWWSAICEKFCDFQPQHLVAFARRPPVSMTNGTNSVSGGRSREYLSFFFLSPWTAAAPGTRWELCLRSKAEQHGGPNVGAGVFKRIFLLCVTCFRASPLAVQVVVAAADM